LLFFCFISESFTRGPTETETPITRSEDWVLSNIRIIH
jgi:hypothetical protein